MTPQAKERSKQIIKFNMIGIVINLLLAVFKIIAGTLANAHAVMLDGINSLSDMISSLITVLASVIGSKKSDQKHPLGYGRIEYIGSLVVTIVIIYIGVTTLIHSIDSIIHPHDAPDYTVFLIIVMVISLICKFAYGLVMRVNGKKLRSPAMIMTGTDSIGDALISVSILIGIVIYRTMGVDIEHYLCIAISLMIMHTGMQMIRESVTKILGTRISPETRKKITDMVIAMPEVLNVSNLVMHNYGEGVYVASLDIEVDEKLTADEIAHLSRRIIRKSDELGVQLTSVGVSGTNTSDPGSAAVWDRIIDLARSHKGIKRVHSFMLEKDEKVISFYLVPDYSFKPRNRDIESFRAEVQKAFPDMKIDIYKAIDM